MSRFSPLNNKGLTFHFSEFSQLEFGLEIVSHLAQDQVHNSLGVLIISDHGICEALFVDDEVAFRLGFREGNCDSLADFRATE
jgi:hypothetical protein